MKTTIAGVSTYKIPTGHERHSTDIIFARWLVRWWRGGMVKVYEYRDGKPGFVVIEREIKHPDIMMLVVAVLIYLSNIRIQPKYTRGA